MARYKDTGYTVHVFLAHEISDAARQVQEFLNNRSLIGERCVSVSHHTEKAFASAIVTMAEYRKVYE